MMISPAYMPKLRKAFNGRMQEHVSLKRFTSARIGGLADVMVIANSSSELVEAARILWENSIPFFVLGSGSNILVADEGVRQVVLLNNAKKTMFNFGTTPPTAWAESGANLGALARRAAVVGLAGLEWAAAIPGTVGGAVYGNAGAHGSDISACLAMAKILHHYPADGTRKREILVEEWPSEKFEYGYRSSGLKRQPGLAVVLEAELNLSHSTPEAVQEKMTSYKILRNGSQPPGASMGSVFKNPVGDYAGRLIEAAGLKGMTIGKVEISRKHANFFISQDSARAADYASLIYLAQDKVMEKFGVRLELEIELVGDWSGYRKQGNGKGP